MVGHQLTGRALCLIVLPPWAPLWTFSRIDTLLGGLPQWVGRLIRPQGKLTLSMSINEAMKARIEAALHIFEAAT